MIHNLHAPATVKPQLTRSVAALTIVATILGMMKNLVFGFLVNEILESSDQSEAKNLLHKYVLFLVVCEVIEMVIGGAGSALLAVCGERITVRLRNVTYSTILSQVWVQRWMGGAEWCVGRILDFSM